MSKPDWEVFENDVQKLLDLRSCISSGSKWYDPGDGTARNQYDDNPFRIIMDAKCTEKKSFSLNAKFIAAWRDKAATLGKRFIMPVRFLCEYDDLDYVVLGLDDFAELLALAKGNVE